MKDIFEWTKVLGGAMCSFATYFLGGWDLMLRVLISLTVLDFITGVILAIYSQKLSSDVGYKGVLKKVGIYIIVALAVLIDTVLNTNVVLRSATIGFYIVVESISITENLGNTGLPLPSVLKKALEQLKDKMGDDEE